MKTLTNFCLLCLAISSCNYNSSEQSRPASTKIASSFKHAKFENDKRAEIINSLADSIHTLFQEHSFERNIPGISYGIVVDGELVLEGAVGKMNLEKQLDATPKSAFRIASMSKSFTAMAIMKLRDEGKLNLNDPVVKHIPDFTGMEYLTSDSPVIDIENLLTMTAGFPEDNPWGDRQLDESDQMLMDLIAAGPSLSNPPSFEYEYSNTGFALLGNIISRVSGMPYQEYIRENIFIPLGMNETYYEFDEVASEKLALGYRWEDEQWKKEPMLHDGAFGAMGGIITNIEDFSRYVSFQLSAWPPRNNADTGPIRRSSLREMQTPQFVRLYPNARDVNDEVCAIAGGYGFGLSIAKDCGGTTWVSHGGALPGFGSNYVYFPEYGIGLMAFCNLTYTTPWPLNRIKKLIFDHEEIKPRELPASEILVKRQEQIVAWIQSADFEANSEIFAENFFLDKSKEKRMEELSNVIMKAGGFNNVKELKAFNQLRGQFDIETDNGIISAFFTLSPEHDPKVQYLRVSFESNISPND